MLIESYLLEQFEAVARCGTLLTASEDLHISQPSLSRSMKKLGSSDLLIQNSMDALGELIDASNLPFFNSDQMLKAGYQPPDRVALPITDPEAHATYWITCMASEQQKYRSVFSAVRGNMLRNHS